MEYIQAKSLVSGYFEGEQWFGNNYNMNIYKGCCHGCIYCDSRSDCYRVENFDIVRAKKDALQIIEKDLQAKRRTGVIGTGAMSDPYNPYEATEKLTRGALRLVYIHGFGISIATKSPLITRDIDLLQKIKEQAPVLVKVTVTTADDSLCGKIEQNAPLSSKRFHAIRTLSENGIFTGVLFMPVLPFIEDTPQNICAVVEKAAQSGARFIFPQFGVTLRSNQRDWFYKKLDEVFPGVKEKYIKAYGDAYTCVSPRAKELRQIFKAQCEKHGILYRMQDIIGAYKASYQNRQLSLF